METLTWLELVKLIFSGGGGLAAITTGVAVIRRLNRDESLRRDYPPHRHINGSISYPREYQPGQVDHLPTMENEHG